MSFQINSLNSDLIDEVVTDSAGNSKTFKLKRLSFAATMQLHASAMQLDKLPSDTEEGIMQRGKAFLDHLLLLYPESTVDDFNCFSISELPEFYKHSMAIASGKSVEELNAAAKEHEDKKKPKDLKKK